MSDVRSDAPGYRPDIDGLRAVAVLPVLFFHAGVSGFSGGFVGVDIFFVISGYLITGIIQREIDEGRFSVARFYERRVRRILPALVVVVGASLLVAPLLLLPEDLRTFGRSAVAAIASLANFNFLIETGYFQSQAELKPLLHTWSLGVEEQFYIVFPVLLIAARFRSGVLAGMIYLLLVTSFGFCIWQTALDPSRAFFLSPARGWELLIGSALALGLVPSIASESGREIASLTGLLAILLAICAFSPATSFPGFAAALPCAGAALVILSGQAAFGNRLLSWPPIVFVGLISYSLYLWHWPLLAFARYRAVRALSPIEVSALIGVAIVLAAVTWRWVEVPFRRPTLGTRRQVFAVGALVAAGVAVVGLLFYGTHGLPGRATAPVLALAAGRTDSAEYRDKCLALPVERFLSGDPCRLGSAVPPSAMLWGDSHADSISPAIDAVARRAGIGVLNASHTSCPPLIGVDIDGIYSKECRRWNDAVGKRVAEKDIGTVILVGRWAAYATGRGYGPDEGLRLVLGSDNRRALIDGLARTLDALRSKRVFLMLSVPELRVDAPSALAREAFYGTSMGVIMSTAEHRARQAVIAPEIVAIAKAHGATVIDPASILCGQRCAIAAAGHSLYVDNQHLSTHGALALAPLFRPVLNDGATR